MRAIEHYREAEELVGCVVDQNGAIPSDPSARAILAAAQVRATLALAGATALQAYSSGDEPELDEWQAAAGGEG